jgi:D-alanyl-D-alanine carboxypeptidase/D-alanyl-D-alanine-endopeptidase (penicillin-binding protein 4)
LSQSSISGNSVSARPRPGRQLLGAAIPLLLGACAAAPRGSGPVPAAGSLAAVVDSIVASSPLDRTHWGIEIYDPAARRVLYANNAERHFIPASNTKLVVTGVALGELGADYRYRTQLYSLDRPGGTLLLVARGDPTLSRRFHPEGPTPLEELADSVVAAGITSIPGGLVIDASYFEDRPVHPAWEIDDLTWGYAAPTDAFAVEEATLRVVVEPGAAPGEPARVTPLVSPHAVTVRSAAVTDTAGARRGTRVRRLYLSDVIEVAGTVPLGASPDTLLLAAPYPALLAAHEFVATLQARGVEVGGEVRVVRDPEEAAALRDAGPDSEIGAGSVVGGPARGAPRLVATWHSAPLSEIAAAILKPSQNWIAEQLLKTLGAERGEGGSWREGVAVERRYLVDVVGIDSTAFWLSDGSGLTVQNLLTPHAIVQLLDHARRRPWGTIYLQAQARPGEDGTLERRLTGLEGRLFAKTGSGTHVNALSGYLRAANGRELLFSIMTNASGWPAGDVRRAIDAIVQSAAGSLSR